MSCTSFRLLPQLPAPGQSPQLLMSCPRLQAATDEAQNNTQAPYALVLMSALSAISVVVQGLVDVRKPNGQVGPTSLMVCVMANSGERKTTVEDVFMQAIRDYQDVQDRVYQAALEEWNVLHAAWEAKKQAILSNIKKKAIKGGDITKEEQLLLDLERSRPAKPKKEQFLYDDTTPEALYFGMHQNIPTAAMIQSEGGLITNGRAFKERERLSALWSGSPISVERKSVESFRLENARLTVSIMLQESAMHLYMKRDGEQARGSGLLARFLTCYPASTQGTRFLRSGAQSWEHCDKFAERLTELLQLNTQLVGEGSVMSKRREVQCAPEASEYWQWMYNETEAEIRPGGRFDKAGDHASKLAENILRVAVLLHTFEGFEGDISLETLKAAASICFYCSDEFMRLFVPPPQEQMDAEKLLNWLLGFLNRGYRYIPKNYALQRFAGVRTVDRLNRALDVLSVRGVIAPHSHGRMVLIDMKPHLPTDSLAALSAVQGKGAM